MNRTLLFNDYGTAVALQCSLTNLDFIIQRLWHCGTAVSVQCSLTNLDFIIQRLRHCGTAVAVV